MRTRSEWFLGPKDGDLLCVIPNTCSNCYLTVHNNVAASTGNYLGGGSTRDMRRVEQTSSGPSSAIDHAEAVNTSLYLFYKHQQQQNQQQHHHHQRQSFHMAPDFMMDTDDGYMPHQASTHSTSMHHHQQPLLLTSAQQQLTAGHPLAGTGGLYLDANYGIYDFDDKNILISTTTCCTTTTTTTTTTSTFDNIFYNNYNNNNNFDNNKHQKLNQENNNSYTLSNRQHLMKNSSIKDITLSQTPPPQQQTTLVPSTASFSSLASINLGNKTSNASTTHHNMHAYSSNSPNHYRNMSQYYSTESLLSNHNIYLPSNGAGYEEDDNERPCCSSSTLTQSKLSYHSPRQQHLNILDHSQKLISYQHLPDDISSLNSTNANITTTSTNCTSDGIEEVDYVLATHYRHSTPMLQTRHLRQQAQALRRQRQASTSSTLYQSFNASLQAPAISAAANRGGSRMHHYTSNSISGHNSRNSSLYESQPETRSMSSSGGGGGSGNFVSIIFNVLDFLF